MYPGITGVFWVVYYDGTITVHYYDKTMVNVPGVTGVFWVVYYNGTITVHYHGKTMVNVPWYYRGVLGSVLQWYHCGALPW